MKKLLVLGLAALSLSAVIGNTVYASVTTEGNNTTKIEQEYNENEEMCDKLLEISDNQIAELKEGKELTLDEIILNGLNEEENEIEDIMFEIEDSQLENFKNGAILNIDGKTINIKIDR